MLMELEDQPWAIGQRLIAMRNALGRQQIDICKECGFAQPNYSMYERGTRKLPLETAIKLRARYQVTLEFLYFGSIAELKVGMAEKISQAHKDMPSFKEAHKDEGTSTG